MAIIRKSVRVATRIILLLTCAVGVACDRTPAQGASASSIPDFEVATLGFDEDLGVKLGPWRPSRDVFKKQKLSGVLAASWCPHSKDILDGLKNLKAREKIDGVFYYEDEVEKFIAGSLSSGDLTEEQAKAGRVKFKGKLLLAPQDVEPYHFSFLYVIRSKQFESLLDGYPTVFECGSAGCEKSIMLRLAIDPSVAELLK